MISSSSSSISNSINSIIITGWETRETTLPNEIYMLLNIALDVHRAAAWSQSRIISTLDLMMRC